MKSCTICKTINDNDNNYCKYCGSKFDGYVIIEDSNFYNYLFMLISITLLILSIVFYDKLINITYLINLLMIFFILFIILLFFKIHFIKKSNMKLEDITLVQKEEIINKYKPKKYDFKLKNYPKYAVNIIITILLSFTIIMLYLGVNNYASLDDTKNSQIVEIFDFNIKEVLHVK